MIPATFALELVVKATAVLIAAGAGSVLLRRSPACYRHRMLALALAGTGTLPAWSLLLPGWRLAVLPSQPSAVSTATPAAADRRASPGAVSGKPVPQRAVSSGTLGPIETPSRSAPTVSVRRGMDSLAARTAGVVLVQPGKQSTSAPRLPANALFLIWLTGVGVVLFRAGLSWRRLRSLSSRSERMPEGAASRMQSELVERFQLRRPIRLRCLDGPEPVAPATWGLFSPTILLPGEARNWSEERLRAVLTHELSHVRRGDWAWQVLAGAVCAVYWFHPCAWWIAGRMRWEAELACDDEVLSAGISAADYARQLLEVVQMVRREGDTGTLVTTMGRSARLSTRLEAILDQRRHRTVGGRAASAALAAVVVAAVSLISSGRVSARPESRPLSHSSRIVRAAATNADSTPRTVPAVAASVTPAEPSAELAAEPASSLAGDARSDMPPASTNLPVAISESVDTTRPAATSGEGAEKGRTPVATTTANSVAAEGSAGTTKATTPAATRVKGSEQLTALLDRRKALEQELKLIDEQIDILRREYRAGIVPQEDLLQATIQRAHVQATIAQNDAFLQSLENGRVALQNGGSQAAHAAEVALAEARVDQAKAQVDVAEVNLFRVEKLLAAHAVTNAEVQQAQAELRSRQASLNVAHADLTRQKAVMQSLAAHGAGDAVAAVIEGVRARLERVTAEEKSLDAALQQSQAKKEGASHTTDRLKRALDGIRKERRDLEKLLQDLQKDGGKRGQVAPPTADPVELATILAKIKEQEAVLDSVRELRKISDARFAAGQASRAEGLKLEVQEQDALQSLAALKAQMAELERTASSRHGF